MQYNAVSNANAVLFSRLKFSTLHIKVQLQNKANNKK